MPSSYRSEPALILFLALLAMIAAFVSGGRTLSGSAAGLQAARLDDVAIMSIRAAGTQVGLVVGAALGGAALTAWGHALLGARLSILSAPGAVPHLAVPRTPAHPDGLPPATERGHK